MGKEKLKSEVKWFSMRHNSSIFTETSNNAKENSGL